MCALDLIWHKSVEEAELELTQMPDKAPKANDQSKQVRITDSFQYFLKFLIIWFSFGVH